MEASAYYFILNYIRCILADYSEFWGGLFWCIFEMTLCVCGWVVI